MNRNVSQDNDQRRIPRFIAGHLVWISEAETSAALVDELQSLFYAFVIVAALGVVAQLWIWGRRR